MPQRRRRPRRNARTTPPPYRPPDHGRRKTNPSPINTTAGDRPNATGPRGKPRGVEDIAILLGRRTARRIQAVPPPVSQGLIDDAARPFSRYSERGLG